ncbi:MAG: hypothetical protein WA359_08890 [Acidimicrobiales bacterium]
MYTIHATKKLLDRMQEPIFDSIPDATTSLGNWFAKPLFWRPQYALFVSHSTFLPVFAPLSPASSLANRFPDDLATTLQAHGVPDSFIKKELLAMDDVVVARTNSRQVVGVMNEFATMATRIRDLHPELTPLQVAVELAEVPVGIHGREYRVPIDALRKLVTTERGGPYALT